ncbi:SRPBCC family protein [Roseomonas rosulenta]|uniref:SRPBCC family protein n=1 Tax=Roseomonas rosulenta TaxID=2748667 RepID=UPI0018DFAC06|nr:SRPBCC family protein [Roseomonas rosulenta]
METLFDPGLDLALERMIEAPPRALWACWTRPDLMEQWFCPVPWKMTDIDLDLRPGGHFRGVIRGPGGEAMPNVGCYLDVLPERRLVWTDALAGGYRPKPEPFMTGIITFEPAPGGTLYRAMVLHADAEARAKHEAMGFHDGWGKATDQLAALARRL